MEVSHELQNVYADAIKVSQSLNQLVGENKDYYITLWQLEAIIKKASGAQVKNERP